MVVDAKQPLFHITSSREGGGSLANAGGIEKPVEAAKGALGRFDELVDLLKFFQVSGKDDSALRSLGGDLYQGLRAPGG
jgi:hypothetical protein